MRPFRAVTTVSKHLNNSTPQHLNTSTSQHLNAPKGLARPRPKGRTPRRSVFSVFWAFIPAIPQKGNRKREYIFFICFYKI
ncbi:hypothetical protein BFO_2188 [Tannerella forsythia 92A2]|uniref:Uncharacterized protein n=1 Tax=Tannerella forsythia (strain ATCC 43037 / JCM 10827 / CCUG 21028 A / KCTC 5666 / FDC 338) TaxID=203275 RepID=G8UIN5_TANFA|nr:hypothetical protein BFO_2188 [Tannerella forsythia 92A2]